MAKITITIEDIGNGKVRAVMNPTGFTIARMIMSGEDTTNAHGIAIAALNAILKEQKLSESGKKIIIPKIVT